MLPSRASDAGPDANRPIHPEDVTYRCGGCGEPQTDTGSSCKGAEGCEARICADCERAHTCEVCGWLACSAHIVTETQFKGPVFLGRRSLCDICRADEARGPQDTEYQDSMPVDCVPSLLGEWL